MKTILYAFSFVVATASVNAAVIATFDLKGVAGIGLLPGNEPGAIVGGTGGEIGAGIFLDDNGDADPNTNTLTINVGWGSSQGFVNLSSLANNSHVHGPTATNNGNGFTQTAGVLANLTRSSNAVTGGTITQNLSYTATQVVDLMNGKHYINIHTATNGGGEMRGFIVVPEPSSAALAAVGVLGLLSRRRSRSA